RLMQRDLSHVVPIFDAGQDANSDRYFLVMPVCDCSLQDKIDESEDGVDINTANDAITAIIAGLQEVGDITHRDLKPANILLHDGKWKVADFGIAKFVEDSTSLETLRDSLTPAYAAPEQWQGERPSSATDVYALGCIIHALINGQPPFDGSVDDIREKHLHSAPAQISKLSSRFSVFVSQMLRKPSDARPTLVRCSQVLPGIRLGKDAESGSHSALAEAAKQVAGWEAQEEAERQAADTLRRKRDALFEDAKREMFAIRDRLFNSIKEQSESVKITPKGFLAFGHAGLELKCEPEKIEKFIIL
ncbi:MAG: serine/threonine protein kinase, partial [Bacteroidetes bacterium]|nr:serine/threonine protein kinase [Bacteroidota bacterium]